jgi:hypothetical protein
MASRLIVLHQLGGLAQRGRRRIGSASEWKCWFKPVGRSHRTRQGQTWFHIPSGDEVGFRAEN